ncbi:MAG: hypothetical protein HYX91_03290 [Chloroflexi bacterium]|nr:hypothetical protein [Chloroflexota bacterium]
MNKNASGKAWGKGHWLLASVTLLLLLGVALLLGASSAQALDENNCLSCHGTPGLTKTNGNGDVISLFVDEKKVNTAAHRYIDCTTCHTAEPHKVETALTKLSLAQKCGSCHEYQYRLHLDSVHGRQLVYGNSDVATCVDCHSSDGSPHSVIRVLEYAAPAYKKNIAQTCARCHGDEGLMASYGIVDKVYESYMRSFHGKAMQLGAYEISQLDKATCANCHGYHDIKPASDPASPVAGLENLAATCEQCHTGAGVKFASGFLGHREASTDNVPVAYYTEIFFSSFLVIVIGFGALIVLLAIVRYSLNRWRE